MGTEAWAQAVFGSNPARELKGPSRWTQAHGYNSPLLGPLQVQGRNEFCSALAIEYLMNLGFIKHAKPQPFQTTIEEFGRQICPDFLIQVPSLTEIRLCVIETKAHRFISPAKQWELDDLRAKFAEKNIAYIVWTDASPLSHPVRQHLMHMRMSSNAQVSTTEIRELLDWVDTKGRGATVGKLPTDSTFDRDTIYAAAWQGLVHFPLTKPLTLDTVIAPTEQDNIIGMFLGDNKSADAWWSMLTNY
ncbi:hypothetical protein [Herbaspirillum camelliae]|uniref:hypothetical protein n=1 Tax=Herbaspirillum camelliae TaxID=1892903 RepID=UPI00094A04F9|nr:hypothetical protein [Herbaspirillum camelliae]